MIYILLVMCGVIFTIADFFTYGLDNFKKWEFYVWVFVIVFNSYILIADQSSPV